MRTPIPSLSNLFNFKDVSQGSQYAPLLIGFGIFFLNVLFFSLYLAASSKDGIFTTATERECEEEVKGEDVMGDGTALEAAHEKDYAPFIYQCTLAYSDKLASSARATDDGSEILEDHSPSPPPDARRDDAFSLARAPWDQDIDPLVDDDGYQASRSASATSEDSGSDWETVPGSSWSYTTGSQTRNAAKARADGGKPTESASTTTASMASEKSQSENVTTEGSSRSSSEKGQARKSAQLESVENANVASWGMKSNSGIERVKGRVGMAGGRSRKSSKGEKKGSNDLNEGPEFQIVLRRIMGLKAAEKMKEE